LKKNRDEVSVARSDEIALTRLKVIRSELKVRSQLDLNPVGGDESHRAIPSASLMAANSLQAGGAGPMR
jgi:hypothetical protein